VWLRALNESAKLRQLVNDGTVQAPSFKAAEDAKGPDRKRACEAWMEAFGSIIKSNEIELAPGFIDRAPPIQAQRTNTAEARLHDAIRAHGGDPRVQAAFAADVIAFVHYELDRQAAERGGVRRTRNEGASGAATANPANSVRMSLQADAF
jgi:hypothetical protein